MWFRYIDYPNFVDFMLRGETVSPGETLDVTFKRAGFKTYRIDEDLFILDNRHWLDDHEFTFFVLRYS